MEKRIEKERERGLIRKGRGRWERDMKEERRRGIKVKGVDKIRKGKMRKGYEIGEERGFKGEGS